mgnify:CR=1 FL=1
MLGFYVIIQTEEQFQFQDGSIKCDKFLFLVSTYRRFNSKMVRLNEELVEV